MTKAEGTESFTETMSSQETNIWYYYSNLSQVKDCEVVVTIFSNYEIVIVVDKFKMK